MTEARPTKPLFEPAGDTARRFDEREKQRWHDRESRTDSESASRRLHRRHRRQPDRALPLRSLLNWEVPFLTGDWVEVMPAFTLSIGATIIANIVFLGYDARYFRHLVQIRAERPGPTGHVRAADHLPVQL